MTVDPYAPPQSEVAGDNGGRRSRARRISFILAVVGFVGFWGAVWLLLSSAALAFANQKAWSGDAAELRAGIAILLAMAAHAAGVGIAFAAPRGRRLAPALVNGASLTFQVAVVLAGVFVAPDAAR